MRGTALKIELCSDTSPQNMPGVHSLEKVVIYRKQSLHTDDTWPWEACCVYNSFYVGENSFYVEDIH